MSGMIKLDRADLVVRPRPELIEDRPRFAVCSSVNGHAQAQVSIIHQAPTAAPRPPF